MKTKIAIKSLIVTGIAFVIGIILIFSSAEIGQSKGMKAMTENGGMMDTNEYESIVEDSTKSYRTGGVVISLVGGFGVLISGYALYNEIDKDSLNLK